MTWLAQGPVGGLQQQPLTSCSRLLHLTPLNHWWDGDYRIPLPSLCHLGIVMGCNEPHCVDCWDRRRRRTVRRIRLVLASNCVDKWVHFWTFSIRNNHHLGIALDQLTETHRKFRNTAQQQRARGHGRHPWLLIDGYIGVMEVTGSSDPDKSGFNAHLHLLCWSTRQWINWPLLIRWWCLAADDPHAHVRPTPAISYGGPETTQLVGYLAKYLAKGDSDDPIVWGGISPSVAGAWADHLRGRRFLRGHYKLPPKPPLLCACGNGDWTACCELGPVAWDPITPRCAKTHSEIL